jgi:hypothetical protein
MARDSDARNTAWVGDWTARVRAALAAKGHQSVSSFLHEHAELTYVQAAEAIGDGIAAVHLAILQMEEAIDSNSYDLAAADALARSIRANMRKGWGAAPRFDFRAASAYSDWRSIVAPSALPRYAREAERPMREADCHEIWRALVEEVKPDNGWLPASGNDPCILRAFRIARKGE